MIASNGAGEIPAQIPEAVPMRPQPHGGALRTGGTNPNAGRPRNELRDALRADLERLIPDLRRRYEAGELDPLKYADFLAKYGLGAANELRLEADGTSSGAGIQIVFADQLKTDDGSVLVPNGSDAIGRASRQDRAQDR